MDYKKLINKKPLGSIERLFSIFLYGNNQSSKYAFKCVNKRLKKNARRFKIRNRAKIKEHLFFKLLQRLCCRMQTLF